MGVTASQAKIELAFDLSSNSDIEEMLDVIKNFSGVALGGVLLNVRVSMSSGVSSKFEKAGELIVILKEIQTELGLKKIRELAGYLGVTRGTIYNWFDGKPISEQSLMQIHSRTPTPELQQRLLALLNRNEQ